MTRGRASHDERDLHALFTAWLEGGAVGDPARDAAVHAAHCVRCRAAMMALDHLSSVDVGRASLPPSRGLAPERAGPLASTRLVAAAASGLVVVAAAGWIGIGAIAPGLLGPGTPGTSTDQEVLGGFGAGSAIAHQTPAASLGGITSESDSATPEAGSATAVPSSTPAGNATPVFVATPVATQAQPPPTSAPASVRATATPTASPTKAPTPSPATPTPEPPLPQCSDGIDNDGDTLIDFGLDPLVNDPECLSPDDDSEGELP
jgi:hypothetical protein